MEITTATDAIRNVAGEIAGVESGLRIAADMLNSIWTGLAQIDSEELRLIAKEIKARQEQLIKSARDLEIQTGALEAIAELYDRTEESIQDMGEGPFITSTVRYVSQAIGDNEVLAEFERFV